MQNNKQLSYGFAFCRFCTSFYQAEPSTIFWLWYLNIYSGKTRMFNWFSPSPDWTTSSLMWGPTWRTWTWSTLRTPAWCSPFPPTRSPTTWASPWLGTASPTPRPRWPTSCSWARVTNSYIYLSLFVGSVRSSISRFVHPTVCLEQACQKHSISIWTDRA